MLNLDFFPVAGNRNRRPQDLLGPKKSNSQSSQESSLSCGSTIYVPQPFIYPSGYPSAINLSTGCVHQLAGGPTNFHPKQVRQVISKYLIQNLLFIVKHGALN